MTVGDQPSITNTLMGNTSLAGKKRLLEMSNAFTSTPSTACQALQQRICHVNGPVKSCHTSSVQSPMMQLAQRCTWDHPMRLSVTFTNQRRVTSMMRHLWLRLMHGTEFYDSCGSLTSHPHDTWQWILDKCVSLGKTAKTLNFINKSQSIWLWFNFNCLMTSGFTAGNHQQCWTAVILTEA